MSDQQCHLDLLSRMGGRSIAVIGDVMLDKFLNGNIDRLSAEAPIPIVDITEETYQLGGAANVVNNLHALGDLPILFSVTGDDDNGKNLRSLIEKKSPYEHFIFSDPSRCTTVKMRTFAQGRQIARADFENRMPIAETISSKILKSFSDVVKSLSAVVIEDYNKGLLTEPFIKKILEIAKDAGVKVLVDPKFENFFAYEGVTLFKPNLRELAEATSMNVSNIDEIRVALSELKQRLNCKNIMVTMGKDGVGLLDCNNNFFTLPAFVRIVNDPAGAGDTVISVMASAIASGSSIKDAMTVANYGGGIICEKVGIQTVSLEELQASIMRNGA